LEFSITIGPNGNVIDSTPSQSKNLLDKFSDKLPDNPYDTGWRVYQGVKGLGLPSLQKPSEAMPGTPEYYRQQNNPHRETPPLNVPDTPKIKPKGTGIEFIMPLDWPLRKFYPSPQTLPRRSNQY
jgi:hypothetical protein